MKKSVLFLIGVIAIISIFVVTFFGTKANLEQFKVYISEVEITNYDRISNGKKRIDLTWDERIGEANIFLEKRISPDNATEKSNVEFTFVSEYVYKDGDSWVFYTPNRETGERETIAVLHSKMGDLTFYRTGSVTVQLASLDGLDRKDSVVVKCK